MPGLLGHATNYVEHPELIADYIVKYAGLVGRGERHRQRRLRLLVAGDRTPPRCTRRWSGRSSAPSPTGAALATKQLWG